VRHEALLFADGGERPSIALPPQRRVKLEAVRAGGRR